MWHPKMRGYMYEIVECFPAPECELGVKVLHVYDNLKDAEIVMAALESVNYNYTCYGIMLRPVWDVEKKVPSDFITATGELHGWDANGSPTKEFPNPCSEIPLKESKPLTDITWIDFKTFEKKVQELCDHSGSTSWVTTTGESGFHCPKCGKSTRTDPWI